MAALTPDHFVKRILVDGLGIRDILVGGNFRFGVKGAGDCDTLILLGEEYGFGVHCQTLLQSTGDKVSSTRIRQAVAEGDFPLAETLLGRPFEIEERVMGGKRRGRGLGFPTANLALSGLLHPPSGVYVVEGWIDGEWLPAVANIGTNPTFGDEGLHLEVHMMRPCGNLYRRVVRIRFLKRLRQEVKFPDAEALKAQIAIDVDQAQDYFANRAG